MWNRKFTSTQQREAGLVNFKDFSICFGKSELSQLVTLGIAVYYWNGNKLQNHWLRYVEMKFFFSTFYFLFQVFVRSAPAYFISVLSRNSSPAFFEQFCHFRFKLSTIGFSVGVRFRGRDGNTEPALKGGYGFPQPWALGRWWLFFCLVTQPSRTLSTLLGSQGLHECASKHSCLYVTESPGYTTNTPRIYHGSGAMKDTVFSKAVVSEPHLSSESVILTWGEKREKACLSQWVYRKADHSNFLGFLHI